MKKRASFTGFMLVLLLAIPAGAQPLIGRHAQDIEQYMRSQQRDFTLDQTTRNNTYHYLKYVDRLGFKTMLVFLSEQDTCTWYKIVYDNNLYPKILESLNACCQPAGDDSWIEEIGGEQYRKVLKKEDWFFTVTTRPKETSKALKK